LQYTCKRCKIALCTAEDEIRHLSTEITYIKKGKRIITDGNTACDSIFVPLQDWMKLSDTDTTGNLNCKGCKVKIGRWSLLDDANCVCGANSPAPSFRINPKSVDISLKSAPVITTPSTELHSDEDTDKQRPKKGKGRGKKKR